MERTADSFGRALFELGVLPETVARCRELLEQSALEKALCSPVVSEQEKHGIIDRLFPEEIRNFMKVLCDNGGMEDIRLAFGAYETCRMNSEGILAAELTYAKEPEPAQIEALKTAIAKKYRKAGVKLETREDPGLLSGFVLQIGDERYDRSAKGRLAKLYRKLAWR